MTTLFFKKAGLQTLIQDQGRYGYAAFGVPISGAMDKGAARTANWLVDNPLDSPVLEITFMGPQIEIAGDCQMALTGANISPLLNGSPMPMYQTVSVRQKATLTFGRLHNGCRAYLAINGKWQIEPWLESYSALANGGQQTTPQSIIQKGASLFIETNPSFIPTKKIPPEQIPQYSSQPTIRVLPGPEFELLKREEIARFFATQYYIGRDSNRMGYRLEGSTISVDKTREIISSGIVPGTIQLTKSGQPVILMADAQTSGGYYRVANVVSPDIDILAQLKPGDSIRFELVDLEEANEINKTY